MAAYFISDAEIHDPAGYKEYTTKVPVLIAKYGGGGGSASSLRMVPIP